jgi:putative transposase
MCRFLKAPRGLVYYHINNRHKSNRISEEGIILENAIIRIFRESRNNYGTRKIKRQLKREGIKASRHKIGQIMKKYALVSNYTVA